MTREYVEIASCDIDGTQAVAIDEQFMIGGRAFEIDLGREANIEFWKWANFFIKHARPLARKRSEKEGVKVNHGKCRLWCKANNVPVNDIGVPPIAAQRAYAMAWAKGELPAKFR